MRRIVIASHHRFASGLKDTLEFVCGAEDIVSIDAYVDGSSLDDQVGAAFEGVAADDEVLVLTDMMQGSVNQAFLPYMNERVFVVTGVNVPCALELALAAGPLTPDGVRRAVEVARQQVLYVNDREVEVGADDE